MICSYFNLLSQPFVSNLPANQLFHFDAFSEGQKRLDYLKQSRGIMLLTGEPGSGKTTLIRAFASELNPQHFKHYYIPLSTTTALEFYRQLHFELTGSHLHRKVDLFRAIQKAIRDFIQNRKIVPVFIFDEAHFMKNDNFFELQLILNFEFDSINPVIVVLIGQSHLKERLNQAFFAAFNRRILIKYHQLPLSADQTTSFIRHHVCTKLASQSLTAACLAKKSFVSAEEVRLSYQEL